MSASAGTREAATFTGQTSTRDAGIPRAGGGVEPRPTIATTAKQRAQQILENLSDDVTLEQIRYHLHVLQRIEEGERAIDEGRVLSHEDVVRRITEWLEDRPGASEPSST